MLTPQSLENWIRYIESVEPRFRGCYSDTLEFSQKELGKIIFVDSGFILELFWRYHSSTWSSDDTCLSSPWLSNTIRYDLLLLENQLPFFVLQELFSLSFPSTSNCGGKNNPSLIELAFDYFAYYNKSSLSFDDITIRHFTDLIQIFHLEHAMERQPSRTCKLPTHLPSATELSEAGISFRFSKDVDNLVGKRILVNYLGHGDSVANSFNGLWKNITQINFSSHYFYICEKLNDFYRNPCRKLKSTLRRDYCNSPWQTAAIVLLILSFVQTLPCVWQMRHQ
ncbi:unnamed protein product [Sphenostylis stenocarpa]|uniref:Uncharacterized protein n=1 Tax=Sphenostylis stenocarpa TaxID=92480 RepID=A0AA86SVU0_9FABA|nr:unnamed protein product [Sphenostylis stenocarpa]